MPTKHVRTRFAPSPTGFLHIGGLRTALYAYAWAKKHGGEFLLRIEDTDQERYVPDAIAQIVRSLQWVGLQPDEGVIGFENGKVVEKGGCGPYVQSARIELYKKFAQKLLEEKKAYRCFCTTERLEEMRKLQMASKQLPKYDRRCLALSEAEVSAALSESKPHVVRFYVPDGGPVFWEDAVFGKVSFARDQIDDFVMIKADGFPTYNFANVVDDHSMRISHVIRAYEFLSSTPKHLLLYEAFGVEKPVFAHASHILGKDKKKLSKRHAAVSVDEYRKAGYLPQALLNFIALLGWTHPEQKDIFDIGEMVAVFDIEELHKTGAVFDTEKSLWVNSQYIRKLSPEAFADLAIPFLVEANVLKVLSADSYENLLCGDTLSKKDVQAILKTQQSRVRQLSDVPELVKFFFAAEISYDPTLLVWKKMQPGDVAGVLQAAEKALSAVSDQEWSEQTVMSALQGVVTSTGKGTGDIFWPVRVALTGLASSPGPQEVAAALGKTATMARIKQAIEESHKL